MRRARCCLQKRAAEPLGPSQQSCWAGYRHRPGKQLQRSAENWEQQNAVCLCCLLFQPWKAISVSAVPPVRGLGMWGKVVPASSRCLVSILTLPVPYHYKEHQAWLFMCFPFRLHRFTSSLFSQLSAKAPAARTRSSLAPVDLLVLQEPNWVCLHCWNKTSGGSAIMYFNFLQSENFFTALSKIVTWYQYINKVSVNWNNFLQLLRNIFPVFFN